MFRRTADKGQKENQSTLTRNPKVSSPATSKTVKNDTNTKGPVKADKMTPSKRNVLVNQAIYVKKPEAVKQDKKEAGWFFDIEIFVNQCPFRHGSTMSI